jgi:DNA mismatch repair protein MutS
MAKEKADTPLMQQHQAIKARYPDALLLFRVGDFYETFGDDAVKTSAVLGITLTRRNNGDENSSQLAGFPHHALDTYLHKLVKAGYRVAICDQLEDPKLAKGIVKRGVTELVTPGVAINDRLLDHQSNNFLAAIHFAEKSTGIALLDITTGEFFVAEGSLDYTEKLLQCLKPAELVFQRSKQKNIREVFGNQFFTYGLEDWIFDETYANESLLRHFATHSLKGFGVENMQAAISAAGAVLHYLKDTEHPNLGHVTALQRIDRNEHLWMDRFTIRNLELLAEGDNQRSLLQVLNSTVSPMGARMMKRWMLLPLNDLAAIRERLATVEFLIGDSSLRKETVQHIRQAGDLERLVSKVPLKKVNPREVAQIARGLHHVEQIKTMTSGSSDPYIKRMADALNPCRYMADKIRNELAENPPVSTAKGGLIAAGVSPELDELRAISSGGKEYLARLQQQESAATGIPSLKIGFNNVFGYYLEVTHTHKDKVPAGWHRKQTLTQAERYITPELKEYEEKIMGAEEKIMQLELALFEKLLQELQDFLLPMQQNGNLLASLDCLSAFAANATQFDYCKPEITGDAVLQLSGSRHPVIEQSLPPGEKYIANDLLLDPASQQIIILTGPNMSGKSALLRQTALITLMAHIGSYVPCSTAVIPLTDKIFTRVGASDNLSSGESTFMVEMNETASIINNVTARSLVLLDEIGRGTSTYDGISIAWSIVEYLHNSEAQPKTLFATHYHELNELENRLPRVKSYHITNKEAGNKIIFLRKLAPGGSMHSFGIHVARMAGMPPILVSRASDILAQLEEGRRGPQANGKSHTHPEKHITPPKMQLSIFDAHSAVFDDIRKGLDAIDINRLTPVEALLKLQEIKSKIDG